MKTATQYDNPAPGCYFDGTFGQTYNDLRVLAFAQSYGYSDDDADALLYKGEHSLTANDLELLPEIADSAIEYLNTLETRPNVYWQYNDGDFGLYSDAE